MSAEDDIEGLLDSALGGFDDDTKKKKTSQTKQETNVESDLMSLLSKVGFSDDTSPSSIKSEILTLSKLSKENIDNAAATSDPSSIKDTLLQLTKDADNIKDIPSEEEMEKIFGGMSSDNLEQGLDNLLPMMEGMMQSLLSKDLLYPAMKDMNEKFPDWLADNRKNLSDSDYSKYNKQYDITRKICHEFEQEYPNSTEAERKGRFDRIMQYMQTMQELGHPPKEVVGEAGLQMGNGVNPIPGAPDGCIIS